MAKILIVESRYYDDIATSLLDGATAALERAHAQFERITVAGALEIPPAILFAANSERDYDGFVALGCVIRGETYHFEIVAGESARGLMELGLVHGLCVGNGILTVENEQQAEVRARRDGGDKGGDAARACLSLISVRDRFGADR
ncbi:MAG TPA: 6,7-dimethyl-8-ribityllumazine synthase [Rhizomicrobium sp.]|jgi:6,7-dimethyl-8-ribityllumazine synthase|nr:6,7-dimethyl-8-ribityllumazine synthase [Rhizomicrobium sp.]